MHGREMILFTCMSWQPAISVRKKMLLTMYVMCQAATNAILSNKYDHKPKKRKYKEREKRNSSPLPTATPTLPLAFALNVDHHVHPSLPRQIVDAVPYVFEVGVRRCDDVDHTADSSLRVSWPVVVPVVVMVVRVRLVSIVEPEARYGISFHSAQFAEFLEGHLDGVLEVFSHD